MLEFQKVSLAIKNKKILRNISFEAVPKEIIAILGSSGAGKTSLFKILIGEVRPTLGSIKVDDFCLENLSLKNLQKYRRQIGVVFQNFRLLPQKTVFENVAFALEVCGDEVLVNKKIMPLLELVGLQEKKDAFPSMLSGGEQQRVAIARALVHDPKILIADEPTGNLDPRTSREIAELFRVLGEVKGVTIFIATHDPIVVEVLSPRVIRLEAGQVLFDKKTISKEEAFDGLL